MALILFCRWATLGSCLYSSKDTFIAQDEKERSAGSDFRLADPNLWNIRPNGSQVTFGTLLDNVY